MKCNKCGKEILVEQIPEVHVSEVEMPCNATGCDGVATYRNNVTSYTTVYSANADTGKSRLLEDSKDPGD